MMRTVIKCLSILACMLAAPAAFAAGHGGTGGPNVPVTPPGEIEGFLEQLMYAIQLFVEGVLGSLPV